jgi:GNAT superfamily N-acetyltransferase
MHIIPVITREDFLRFTQLPWRIYRDDPFWVPPLINDILYRLDVARNPFWKTSERECWLALDNDIPVGRICAIAYRPASNPSAPVMGRFGFFECINDQETASSLFTIAADWLKVRRLTSMEGPYNPSQSDEIGIMIDGFDTLPVALAGHNPPYYQNLFLNHGFAKNKDTVARHYIVPRRISFEDAFPKKLMRVVEIARKRNDVTLRKLKLNKWEDEIRIATEIFNAGLATLPGYIPITYDEFLQQSKKLKLILDPKMAIMAEIDGRPVGYAVAYPDVNEALQKANGKLDLPGSLRFFIKLASIKRVSFKILMVLPEFHGRGIEALLIHKVSRRIWQKKYREVDMSLAVEENIKSNRFTDNLGFEVYLRYRIYEKAI